MQLPRRPFLRRWIALRLGNVVGIYKRVLRMSSGKVLGSEVLVAHQMSGAIKQVKCPIKRSGGTGPLHPLQ